MANNLIQIKRSNTSATPANTLVSGELAYSYNSNALFIGAQTGISAAGFKVGGAKFGFLDNATQGTLTANAAQIVDANAFISNTYTSGLFVAPTIASPVANSTAALITSISPQGSGSQLGASAGGSNTELVTSWAIKTYVDGKTAAGSVNTAAQFGWTNNHTFSNNISMIGNGSVLALGNSTIAVAISANGSNGTSGQALLSNGTSVYWGTPTGVFSNGTAYTWSAVQTFNSNVAIAGNATAQLLVGTTAANLIANQSTVALTVNSTALTTVNSTMFNVSNGTSRTFVDITGVAVGNTAANAVLSTSAISITVNATANSVVNSTVHTTSNGTAYTNLAVTGISTSAGSLLVGNTAANTTINSSTQATYANATTYTLANTTAHAIIDTTTSTQLLLNTTAVQLSTGAVRVGNTATNTVINTTALIAQSNTAQFGTAFYSFANGMVAVGNAAPSNTFSVNGNQFISGKLQIGTMVGFDFGSLALIEVDSNQNSYSQIVMQNANNGTSASGDFVITADTGNDSVNFLDIGINSSGYNQAAYNIGGALDAYIYSSNSNLTIGTATVKDIIFHAGGTTSADRKLTVNTTTVTFANSVALVANGSNGSSGQVLTSNGTGIYWSTLPTQFSNGTAYTWSATQTFNSNVAIAGNATSQLLVGTTAANLIANSSAVILSVNSTANAAANSTAFTVANGTAYSNVTVAGFSTSAGTLNVGNTATNVAINTTTVAIGTATVNSTVYSGTANNATNLNGQPASFYTNATNITTGTLPHAQLPANVVIWSNTNTFTANQTFNVAVITSGNATSYFAAGTGAANAVVNATAVALTVNSTASATVNSTTFNVSNGTARAWMDVAGFDAGNTAANATLTATALSLTVNATANVVANSTVVTSSNGTAYTNLAVTGISTSAGSVLVGNTAANATLSATALALSVNATANVIANSTVVSVANGTAYTNVSIAGFSTSAGTLNVGNTATNVAINATTVAIGTASVNSTVYTGTANNATNLNGQLASFYTNATNINTGTLPYAQLPANVVIWSNTNTFTANQTFNVAVVTSGNATSYFAAGTGTANAVVNATAAVLTVNSTASAVHNSTAFSVSNGTSTTTITVANVTAPSILVGGQITANATAVSFGTVANISATSANLAVNNITVSGNLNVQGTISTIDTTTLQVKDNVILLADQNSTGDSIDFGVVGQANSGLAGTQTFYGFARIAAANAFQFFATNTSPSTTTIAGQTTMPLQAFLQPYGSGGAFVVNSTTVALTANATVNVSITANTLTLATALAPTSGGTGRNTNFTTGDMLYASNATFLSSVPVGTNGQILEIRNSIPQWGTLDGGTF